MEKTYRVKVRLIKNGGSDFDLNAAVNNIKRRLEDLFPSSRGRVDIQLISVEEE